MLDEDLVLGRDDLADGSEVARSALDDSVKPSWLDQHEHRQFEGRRVRPPVFLARRPDEPLDRDLADWYRRLLATVAEHGVRRGEWRLHDPVGWPDNQSCRSLLGFGGAGLAWIVGWSQSRMTARVPGPEAASATHARGERITIECGASWVTVHR